jgi:hypothetical protein
LGLHDLSVVASRTFQRRAAAASVIFHDLRTVDSEMHAPLDLIAGRCEMRDVHAVRMSVGTLEVLSDCLERSTRNSAGFRSTPHAGWSHERGCKVAFAPEARAHIFPHRILARFSIFLGRPMTMTLGMFRRA